MNNKIIVFLVVAFLFVIGITLVVSRPSVNSPQDPYKTTNNTPVVKTSITPKSIPPRYTTPATPVTPGTESLVPSYTLAQVAVHSSASSCWTIVGANVYDVTSWINSHPGGSEAILSMCGKDATAAFENQHGGQTRPENELNGFQIGTYKK